jgi:hypothetical protein
MPRHKCSNEGVNEDTHIAVHSSFTRAHCMRVFYSNMYGGDSGTTPTRNGRDNVQLVKSLYSNTSIPVADMVCRVFYLLCGVCVACLCTAH